MIRSGNPALKASTFLDLGSGSVVSRDAGAMTLNGTVNKTGFLLLLSVLTAAFAWNQSLVTGADGLQTVAPGILGYMLGGAIGGLFLALVTTFKKQWSPVTAPLYALVEGFFLGAISAMYEVRFNGIFIESGVDAGAPKYMEWYGAFGLMVTLVWLYIEFLRLLSKLQSRN